MSLDTVSTKVFLILTRSFPLPSFLHWPIFDSSFLHSIRLLILCTRLLPIALAIDVTGRNMQDVVKGKGLPWAAAKGFDTFAPVGLVFAPNGSQIVMPS
jgi:hypothetical protein